MRYDRRALNKHHAKSCAQAKARKSLREVAGIAEGKVRAREAQRRADAGDHGSALMMLFGPPLPCPVTHQMELELAHAILADVAASFAVPLAVLRAVGFHAARRAATRLRSRAHAPPSPADTAGALVSRFRACA